MDLDRYTNEAHKHCDELAEELITLGVDDLSDACQALGADQFTDYCMEYRTEMVDYVRKSPSQRKMAHRNLEGMNRAIFVLGAFYYARCGSALLDNVTRYGVGAGPSYRMITAQSASAATNFLKGAPSLWPFEDIPDPFDGAVPVYL